MVFKSYTRVAQSSNCESRVTHQSFIIRYKMQHPKAIQPHIQTSTDAVTDPLRLNLKSWRLLTEKPNQQKKKKSTFTRQKRLEKNDFSCKMTEGTDCWKTVMWFRTQIPACNVKTALKLMRADRLWGGYKKQNPSHFHRQSLRFKTKSRVQVKL